MEESAYWLKLLLDKWYSDLRKEIVLRSAKNGTGTYTTSYSFILWFFSRVSNCRSVNLTTHLHLSLRLRMHGYVSPLFLAPLCRAGFIKHRDSYTTDGITTDNEIWLGEILNTGSSLFCQYGYPKLATFVHFSYLLSVRLFAVKYCPRTYCQRVRKIMNNLWRFPVRIET